MSTLNDDFGLKLLINSKKINTTTQTNKVKAAADCISVTDSNEGTISSKAFQIFESHLKIYPTINMLIQTDIEKFFDLYEKCHAKTMKELECLIIGKLD